MCSGSSKARQPTTTSARRGAGSRAACSQAPSGHYSPTPMPANLRSAGAAILVAGPTVLAFFSGGFFDRPRLIAALVAWALVVVVALVAPRPLPARRPARVALLGLLALCAWTALSLLWTPTPGRAEDDLQRLLLYTGVFIAALSRCCAASGRGRGSSPRCCWASSS